ncbi:hypothetical protein J6X09_01100 [Candidatus Saccharibacteria bacterium]|nr:hypothetical protein [Candidatus Saccharibacteria bacterium]
MDSEEPIVSGSLDDSPTEDVELNNKEGSDMGETPEEAPLFGKAKKSEPVVTPAPSAEPVATAPVAAPKKKSHAGLIITIIVLVLLLVGGGVAAFLWMMWHESAETSINDAVAKTFEAKDRTISGTLTTGGSAGGIKVTFDGAQSDGNFGGSGKLSFAGLIDVKFNASMMKDGDIYFKLDGVKDALKTLPIGDIIGSFAGGSSSTNGMDVSELISELVGPVAEVIDGEWIKVSADDLGGITKQGSECDYNGVLGIFSGDAAKEVTEAYKKNTFIVQKKDSEVEDKDGVKYYVVEIDEKKATAFGKAIKNSDFGKKLSACTSKETEDSEEASFVANKDTKIRLGIKPWSHELVAVEVESKSKQTGEVKANLEIGYEKKSVEEPSDAKTVDKIKSKIESAIKKGLSNYMTSYAKKICQSTYGAYGSAYVEACVKQISGSLGDFDDYSLEDLFGNGFSL